jgi:hypothetical protein
MRFFFVLLLILASVLAACSSSSSAPPACAATLASYCSQAKCLTQVSLSDSTTAACDIATAVGARVDEPSVCGDYVIFGVDAPNDRLGFLYDHTGALVAVESANANGCVGGPASFAPPSGCTAQTIFACTPR